MTEIKFFTKDIFTISNFFTNQECEELIEFSEQIGYTSAPVTTHAGPVMMPDVRNNSRVMVDDISRAESLWDRLKSHIPTDYFEGIEPIGLNERLRFYRYDPGEQFNWHFDGAFRRDNGERSWLTFMIYLNEEFSGGETKFETRQGMFDVVPETGMALIFVHRTYHQGAPVIEGRKYVLRSDVMYSAAMD